MGGQRILALSTALGLVLSTSGCSEAKAKAVMLAAEEFGRGAEAALSAVESLFEQSLAMPLEAESERAEKLAVAFDKEPAIDEAALSFLLSEEDLGKRAQGKLAEELDGIRRGYVEVRTVYRSLSGGARLSARTVARSEKLVMRLAGDIYRMGANLAKQPVQFSGRRTRLVEAIQNDKKITDKPLREARLRADAHAVLALRKEEMAARTAAVRRCYLAAESGQSLANLARHYRALDAESILEMTKESVQLGSDLGFRTESLDGLLKRIESAESALRADPYWKPLLAETAAK